LFTLQSCAFDRDQFSPARLAKIKAFSSEVDPGSRKENASKQKLELPFRFNRNGTGSSHNKTPATTMEAVMFRLSVCAATFVIGVFACLQGARAADAVPKFDIVRNCKVEISGGSGIGETLASCVADEERSRDELSPQWTKFLPSDKTVCIRETSIDGAPSYVELQTCLEITSGRSSSK
jgi:hypothetical protein